MATDKQKGIHLNDVCAQVTKRVNMADNHDIISLVMTPEHVQKVTKHFMHNKIADFNTTMHLPSLAGQGTYTERDHMGHFYNHKTGSRRVVDVAIIPLPSYEGQVAPIFHANGTLNKEYRRFLCDNYRVVLLVAPEELEADLEKFYEYEPEPEI